MTHILFHVPHSSLKIPKMFWDICIKDRKYIIKSNQLMCDFLTDKLLPSKCHKLIFKYSRLFCDVEKYVDDKKESMFKKGMGVIYTNDCENTITDFSAKYKNKVLKSYYYKHHNKFDKMVTKIIKEHGKCTIIDFHSFSNEMVEKLFDISDNSDICIGVDNSFTDKPLLDFTINHFKKYGYSITINKPYSGTIVPNKYFNKKKSLINSIMIEINKEVYLKNKSDYLKFKNCIKDYYKKIQLL